MLTILHPLIGSFPSQRIHSLLNCETFHFPANVSILSFIVEHYFKEVIYSNALSIWNSTLVLHIYLFMKHTVFCVYIMADRFPALATRFTHQLLVAASRKRCLALLMRWFFLLCFITEVSKVWKLKDFGREIVSVIDTYIIEVRVDQRHLRRIISRYRTFIHHWSVLSFSELDAIKLLRVTKNLSSEKPECCFSWQSFSWSTCFGYNSFCNCCLGRCARSSLMIMLLEVFS